MAEVTSLKEAQCPWQPSDVDGISKQQECYTSLNSTFNLPTGRFVTLMRSSSSGKCWIQYDDTNDLTLMDKTGSCMESLTCHSKITGIDFQNEDDIFFCAGNHITHALKSSKLQTTFASTKSLIPRDLCVSSDGDVYVTLEDNASYTIMQHSERIVARYTSQGQVKARAKYDHQGNLLFVRPNRIIINSKGDRLFVIDYTDQGNSHVVVLNAVDLSLRLRYLGNGEVVSGEQTLDSMTYTQTTLTCTPTKMTFTPRTQYAITDIGLDVYDNLLICEFYSRSVQLLTSECEPMLTILQTQGHVPLLMAVNKSDLWVGFEDGIINVYSVRCNLEPETIDTHF